MQVRPYEETDEQNVISLWREVFPDPPWWNDPALDIRRKLAVQRELFLVADDGGRVVGTAMGGYDGHRGWVYYVAVAPRSRRCGTGTALMRAVEARLTELGCRKLNLQVRAANAAVIDFYRNLGYTVQELISMGKLLGDEASGDG